MNYVTAIITCFNDEDPEEVVLRARGRTIATAVDAAEITRRIFLPDLRAGVSIGTDRVPGEGGKKRAVSTIEITLKRNMDL